MNVADMNRLYAYNRWANDRTLDAVSRIPAEQFTRDLGNSFPSIRDTLTHVLTAEWLWLERWKGTSPTTLLAPETFPDVAALRRRWSEVESDQRAFIDTLTEETLAADVSYVSTGGESWTHQLGKLMQHVANHSTYHRGQITTMLRQLGAEPAPTDYLVYTDE